MLHRVGVDVGYIPPLYGGLTKVGMTNVNRIIAGGPVGYPDALTGL